MSIIAESQKLEAPAVHNRNDGQLLVEVAARDDEACFAELVQRHAATVLAACQRQLGEVSEAEDAAQAVFLVL